MLLSLLRIVLTATLVASATVAAFQPPTIAEPSRWRHKQTQQSPSATGLAMSTNNYLSSLSDSSLSYAAPLKRFPTREINTAAGGAMVLGSAAADDEPKNITLIHAPLSYFAIDQLEPKGPRANADVGTPHDSSRSLRRNVATSSKGSTTNSMAAGSWWCAQGGWPSKKLRTTTEIFFVLQGFGCLTDLDGRRNFFGPGDTVILPKGWSGRWDVAEPIHKVCMCRVSTLFLWLEVVAVVVGGVSMYNHHSTTL